MIRSLSGESTADIRDWHLFHKAQPYAALSPHLNLSNLKEEWNDQRGLLDGIALRLKFSNKDLYESHIPDAEIGSLIFEVLEQIRVESICPDDLRGTKQNIQRQFLSWMQQFMSTGGSESSIGLLLLSIFSSTWMRLNGQSVPQLMQDTIEATRAGLAEVTGPILQQLKLNRFNQKAYSLITLDLIAIISNLIEDEYLNNPSARNTRKKNVGANLKIEWVSPSQKNNGVTQKLQNGPLQDQQITLTKSLARYHVYDSQYDVEIEAKKKIRPAQLKIYQEELNQEIANRNIPWSKLIRIYQNLFSVPKPLKWQTTEAEGQLDKRFFTRLATSPLSPVLYKNHFQHPQTQVKITLLVDCSGSMKEQRLNIAVWVDSLVRIMEHVGIETEVLGYSTVTWQGGRPFKNWVRSGSTPQPGRLNERAHWIFKDFKTSWRRSRAGIAALLRPEIYTESVDGEALLWAAERLQKSSCGKPTNNKVILFSDGCPMDRATIQANGEDFLRDHLINVLAWYEQQANLELWACGIGAEMRPFFRYQLSWDPRPDQTIDTLKNWATEFKKNIGR